MSPTMPHLPQTPQQDQIFSNLESLVGQSQLKSVITERYRLHKRNNYYIKTAKFKIFSL